MSTRFIHFFAGYYPKPKSPVKNRWHAFTRSPRTPFTESISIIKKVGQPYLANQPSLYIVLSASTSLTSLKSSSYGTTSVEWTRVSVTSINTRAASHIRSASVRLALCSAISIMESVIRSWRTTSVRLYSWSMMRQVRLMIEMVSVISVHPSPFWSISSWRNMNIPSSLDISIRMQASHSVIDIRVIINSVIEIITYQSVHIERVSVCYDECIINAMSSINVINCFDRSSDCGRCRAARCECSGRQNQNNEEHHNLFHNQNH